MKVKCGVYDNLRISLTVGKLNQKLNNAKKQELEKMLKKVKASKDAFVQPEDLRLWIEVNIEERLKELGE